MPYCVECGTKIPEGAKFCPACGHATVAQETPKIRKQEYSGTIYKCPNCGEVLKSFEINCPACGYELRKIKASSAVKELESKLEKIESSREQKHYHGLFGSQMLILDSEYGLSKTDKQMVSMIKNFSVPNTKEDMLEFMILATSNVNLEAYNRMQVGISKRDQEINSAWMSKARQVYQKARNARPSDEIYDEIKMLYETCNREVNAAEKKHNSEITRHTVLAVGALILLMVFCVVLLIIAKVFGLE